jgi:UV DNA damage endonuclease
MIRHLGYACQCLGIQNTIAKKKDKIFTDRTLRMDGFSLSRAGDLASKNAADLIKILKWNEQNEIKFFRIGSGMFPFMDHPTLGWTLDDIDVRHKESIKKSMKEAGDFAKEKGMRLSCHPGPYTCICSPNPMVVAKSVMCLNMHSLIGDLLGFGNDFAINIHVGGVYGDKTSTSSRFVENFESLDDRLKNRITLENDDKESMWSISELYEMIASRCDVKLVLDIHHHRFCQKETLVDAAQMAFSTWDGFCEIPKIHYSESATHKKPQAHSNWIASEIPVLSETIEYDVMLETKMKDEALIAYRNLFGNKKPNRPLQVLDA